MSRVTQSPTQDSADFAVDVARIALAFLETVKASPEFLEGGVVGLNEAYLSWANKEVSGHMPVRKVGHLPETHERAYYMVRVVLG